MRESLGWLTNCPDDKKCPQSWLELSYEELPRSLECAGCGRRVEMAKTEDEFDEHTRGGAITAFPVVPCTGAPASYGRLSMLGAPAAPSGIAAAATTGGAPLSPPEPPRRGSPPRARVLFAVLSSGQSIKIDKDSAVIGRSRTCDVVINSAKVSRQHANITRTSGKYFIEDLGSANGIFRNGEKVGRVEIGDGDVYTISEENIRFELR
ncbi:MAG: FHA domain-containing protein [Deltaproteobacteria bacterium]|nr:FHA domain-containing protein [Deltaproteobacteria bacterium]